MKGPDYGKVFFTRPTTNNLNNTLTRPDQNNDLNLLELMPLIHCDISNYRKPNRVT